MGDVRAADGSLNVNVVSGAAFTGIQAANGAINIVEAPAPVVNPVGAMHPCGAWYYTEAPAGNKSIRAPDGSLHVTPPPYTNWGQRITVVTGVL